MAGPVDIQILLHEAGTEKALRIMRGAFVWKKMLAGSAEATVEHKVRLQRAVSFFQKRALLSGGAELLYFMIRQW